MSTTAQIAKMTPIRTMAARATVRLAWRALEVRRHSGSTPAKMTSERSVGGAMPESTGSTKLNERDSAAALSRKARHSAQLSR